MQDNHGLKSVNGKFLHIDKTTTTADHNNKNGSLKQFSFRNWLF